VTKYLIAAVILIVCTVLTVDQLRQDKKKDRLYQQKQDDFQHELEQTRSKLRRSEELRDSILRTTDSLLALVDSSTTLLKLKDKEIATIKGRYNHIKADSLSVLMNRRAENANR